MEAPDGVMIIARIKCTFHVKAPADKRDVVERVFKVFDRACPIHQTLKDCIDIQEELVFEEY